MEEKLSGMDSSMLRYATILYGFILAKMSEEATAGCRLEQFPWRKRRRSLPIMVL